jgi:formate dehydrogenase major subunit
MVRAQALHLVDPRAAALTGEDEPDFVATTPPDYVPPDGARAVGAIAVSHPFILQADGRGWLYAPSGLVDGPLPVHYEPHESPFANRLYSQGTNPARQRFHRRENPYHPSDGEAGADAYPYVMTYRLTEHHTAGGMSRTVPHLAELQPEMFCEVSRELAAERRARARWLGDDRDRAERSRRASRDERIKPLEVQGRRLHQIGLPSTGEAAAS